MRCNDDRCEKILGIIMKHFPTTSKIYKHSEYRAYFIYNYLLKYTYIHCFFFLSITYRRPRGCLPDVVQLPVKSTHRHALTYRIYFRFGLPVRFRLYPYGNSLIDLTEVHVICKISNAIVTLRYNKVPRDQ